MIRVRYLVVFPNDDRPIELPDDAQAVLASRYEHVDIGQGGITTEEIHDGEVQHLGAFPMGSKLFVESSNPHERARRHRRRQGGGHGDLVACRGRRCRRAGAVVVTRRRRERALAPRPQEPLDRVRAVARFGRLVGRGVALGFRAGGPVVDADTPEELRREVEIAIAAETGKQRPS